jgi:hypothetical protein
MIRLSLIFLIIFLVARIFIVYGLGGNGEKIKTEPEKKNTGQRKGVPKSLGEYVDYEEVDKSG